MPARDEEETTIFAKLKHAYLNFVESLREKGVPAPHLLVPLVIILILAAAVIYTQPGLLVEKKQLSLLVKDNLGRPVPEATVQLLGADQQVIETKTTDASGRAQFDSAPLNGAVRVSAEGFTSTENSVATLAGQRSPAISLRSTRTATRNIEVKVTDQNNQPVDSAFVTLTFADGSLAPQATTNAGGSALVAVQESQLNDGTIGVEAIGFTSIQQPVTKDALEAGLPITIKLEPAALPTDDKGTFTVRVSSASGPVRGSRVILIDQFTDAEQAGETTSADGSAVFENVAFGSVLGVKVNAAGFAPFNREFTFTEDDNEFEVILQQRTGGEGQLAITVVNNQASPLAGASVNVFDAGSNKLLGSGETDQTGVYSLELAAGVTAYATAYVDGFLPGFADSLAPGTGKTISLSPVTAGSLTSVTVEVKEDGFPASGSEVSLYRSGGFFLGLPPLHAGAQGLVNATIPLKFDSSSYRVFANASKASLAGQSELRDVSSEPLTLTVDLIALPANVTVTLKDLSNKNPIASGGTIEARVAGITISSCNVETNGECTLTVTANKPFTLYASAPGFLSYSSAQTGFSAGDEASLTLELFPLSLAQGATATFLGLFDSSGAKVREVSNAETYTARFTVTMPQNVESAGFYLRAGDEPSAESSAASITSFESNSASYVQASTQFDPSSTSCYTGETVPSGQGMKWIYLSFPRGFVGTKEISAKVQVSRAAASGENVVLSYRAFGLRDNLPLLAPSDAALLDSLRQKVDEGQALVAEDTCAAQLFSQRVPLTSQPLLCSEQGDAELCYKVSLADSTARGSPSTFQATLGRDVTLELELLSTVAIDSAAIRTSSFRVSGARQTLVGSRLEFANGDAVGSGAAAGQVTNVPFVTVQNRKGKLTLTLSPLLSTQSASLVIVLRSGEKVYEIPLTLTISGTNTFSVSASPQRIPAAQATKVSVLVRDRNSAPVTDATVSFYECSGSPLGGSEPSEVIGDGTLNNGANGRYRTEINPTGLGEIGARVEKDGFKTFEQCLITVEGKNFISVEPQVLEFRGSSQDAAPQQVTVTNILSEPVRVTAGVNCGSDSVPLNVFPSSFTIEPNSDSMASVKVIPNVTASAQCIVTFNARAGLYRAVEEIPVSVNVNCPLCTSSVPATGSASKPLPSTITLFVDPFYLQDAYTIPLALPNDPTCRLDGFRINYGGSYVGGYGAGVPIQRGVLQGLPSPANWHCAACTPGGAGPNNCQICSAQIPYPIACGSCTPTNNPGAPTSSSGVIFDQATCNQCYNAQGLMQAQAFGAPLARRGYPVQFSPAVQCVGRDPTVGGGGFYRDDCGGPQYDRFGQFGILPPALPGSSRYQTFSNYNYGHGPSREAIREALQVEQCARDGITVAADFSFLGEVFPGSGTLFVTLPDGSSKQIRVLVAGGYGGGLNLAPGYYEEQCAISSFATLTELGRDYKLKEAVKFTLTCKIPFENKKYVLKKADGSEVSNAGCTIEGSGPEISLKCDLSQNQEARQVLDSDHRLYLDIEMSSNQNPDAKVSIHIGISYPSGVAQPPTSTDQGQPSATTQPTTQPAQAAATGQGGAALGIIVCRASDAPCTGQNSVCDKQVQVNTPLKVQYSFPPGDVEAERKVEVTKGTDAPQNLGSGAALGNSGSKDHTPAAAGSYSYSASTKVGDAVQNAVCQVTAGQQPVFIKNIYVQGALQGNAFADNLSQLNLDVHLDQAALRNAYGTKPIRVVKTFTCLDDSNFKLYTVENLAPKPNDLTSYNAPTSPSPVALAADGQKKEPFNSLLFTYCRNRATDANAQIDVAIPYSVKVQLYDGTNLIVEKYGDSNGNSVGQSTTALNILFYPEAPLHLQQTAQQFNQANLDPCGRNFDSHEISAVYVGKVAAGASYTYLKSTDSLSAGDELVLNACVKTDSQLTRTVEFTAEIPKRSGGVESISLGSCTLPPLSSTSQTSTRLCRVNKVFDFLTQQEITARGLDPNGKIKIRAKLSEQAPSGLNPSSDRYFCKRWPTAVGCDAGNQVAFGITLQPPRATSSRFCRVQATRNNGNVIECDVSNLDESSNFPLPNGMHFITQNLVYQGNTKWIQYAVSYSSAISGNLLLCDKAEGTLPAQVQLGTITPQSGTDCVGGDTNTPLVKVRVVKVLDPNDVVIGSEGRKDGSGARIPAGRQLQAKDLTYNIVRVRINTLFGATDQWLTDLLPEADGMKVLLATSTGGRSFTVGRVFYSPRYHATADHPRQELGGGKNGIYILARNDVAKITEGEGGIVRYIGPGYGDDRGKFLFEVRNKEKPYVLNCGSRDYQVYVALGGVAVGAGAVFACAIPGLDIITCPTFLLLAGGAATGGVVGTGAAIEYRDALVENAVGAGIGEVATCTSSESSVLIKPIAKGTIPSAVGGQPTQAVCTIISTEGKENAAAALRNLRVDNPDVCGSGFR